ncbi:MAG: hypothetical protein JRC93_01820 [Deltaproteobacteria bacterium]|nr:hypothetical protein [Deltaproteobacteria bacterium]
MKQIDKLIINTSSTHRYESAKLKTKQPFDPSKMLPNPKYLEMSAVAKRNVLAV